MSILVALLVELILKPLFELAMYLTGRLVVPLFTLGYVRVEPLLSDADPREKRGRRRRRSRHPRQPRVRSAAIAVGAEAGALLGTLFWVALAAVWIGIALVTRSPSDAAFSASASCP